MIWYPQAVNLEGIRIENSPIDIGGYQEPA